MPYEKVIINGEEYYHKIESGKKEPAPQKKESVTEKLRTVAAGGLNGARHLCERAAEKIRAQRTEKERTDRIRRLLPRLSEEDIHALFTELLDAPEEDGVLDLLVPYLDAEDAVRFLDRERKKKPE